jgi:hypothetical protein
MALAEEDPWEAAWGTVCAAINLLDSSTCDLLRCTINPFFPALANFSWQTTNAVTLAQTMYDSRDFTAMPLLADLLEEAGCPAEVSAHCRGEGPHVRGCWVIDLLLGKE